MHSNVKKYILRMLALLLILLVGMPIYSKAFVVEYRGDAEGLVTTSDNFFSNFDAWLPGDSLEDIAYIKNTSNDKVKLFFKIEAFDKSEFDREIDYELLKKISLTVSIKKPDSNEFEVIYTGNMGAESMSDFISIGEYEKGYEGMFKFKIDIPVELKNEYNLSTTKLKWIFSAEKIEDESAKGRIKTGDNIIVAVIAFVVVSIVCIIALVLKGKSSKRDDKK